MPKKATKRRRGPNTLIHAGDRRNVRLGPGAFNWLGNNERGFIVWKRGDEFDRFMRLGNEMLGLDRRG